MPQAITAAIIVGLKTIGVTVSAFVASAIAVAVQLAVVLGINFAAQQVFGRGGPAKPSDGQQIIRENVGSRRRHYGIVHVGGTLAFYESKDGTLHAVVASGQGELAEVLEHRLNNKVKTLDGSGNVSVTTSDGTVLAPFRILHRLGTASQAAFAELTAVFPEWTSNHRLRGVSATYLQFKSVDQKHFSEVYEGNQVPAYTKVAKATKVYDPRSNTTAWSDNAALVIADYLAHPDGFGLGTDGINWASFAAAADVCAQLVDTIGGAQIARYRIWGSYDLSNDERRSVLTAMLMACDGFVYQDAAGKACLQVGEWVEPTVHLEASHIVSLTASFGVDALDRTNEVKVVYTDQRFDYTETESAPQRNEAEISRVGKTESQRFDIYYIPHHNQASRIGKRLLAKLGGLPTDDETTAGRWNLNVVCNLYGLNLIGERFCKLTLDELGLEAAYFEVTSLKLDPIGNLVEAGLAQVSPNDFDFDPLIEEGDPPAEPGNTSSPVTIPVPTGLAVTVTQTSIGGVTGPVLQATWNAPTRAGLAFEAQYRETGATTWLPMTVNQDERVAISSIVSTDRTYEVRVRAFTISGRNSAWTVPAAVGSGSGFNPANLFFSGDLGAWYDPSNLSSMFQDVAATLPAVVDGPVARINDRSGNGNHATIGTASARPTLKFANGRYYLLFDGAGDRLNALFAMPQPWTRISAVRQIDWAAGDMIYGGGSDNVGSLQQIGSSPGIRLFDGISDATRNDTMTLNVTKVVTEVHNGASSSVAVGNGAPVAGNWGSGAATGLTMGARSDGTGSTQMLVYGLLMIDRALSAEEAAALKSFMADKGLVSL